MKGMLMNFKLIKNIAKIVKKIVKGSLTINSKTDKKECCISKTSAVILEITSPFFFSDFCSKIFQYTEYFNS